MDVEVGSQWTGTDNLGSMTDDPLTANWGQIATDWASSSARSASEAESTFGSSNYVRLSGGNATIQSSMRRLALTIGAERHKYKNRQTKHTSTAIRNKQKGK